MYLTCMRGAASQEIYIGNIFFDITQQKEFPLTAFH